MNDDAIDAWGYHHLGIRNFTGQQMKIHFDKWLRDEMISRLGGIEAARARFEVEVGAEIREKLEAEEREKRRVYDAQRKALMEDMNRAVAKVNSGPDLWREDLQKRYFNPSKKWEWT